MSQKECPGHSDNPAEPSLGSSSVYFTPSAASAPAFPELGLTPRGFVLLRLQGQHCGCTSREQGFRGTSVSKGLTQPSRGARVAPTFLGAAGVGSGRSVKVSVAPSGTQCQRHRPCLSFMSVSPASAVTERVEEGMGGTVTGDDDSGGVGSRRTPAPGSPSRGARRRRVSGACPRPPGGRGLLPPQGVCFRVETKREVTPRQCSFSLCHPWFCFRKTFTTSHPGDTCFLTRAPQRTTLAPPLPRDRPRADVLEHASTSQTPVTSGRHPPPQPSLCPSPSTGRPTR